MECDICGKEVENPYHIGDRVGHLECFEKAIEKYLEYRDIVKE